MSLAFCLFAAILGPFLLTSGQELQCHVQGQCNGIVMFYSIEDDYNVCLNLCKENNESCSWITFIEDNQECIQFLDCPIIDPQYNTSYSGQAECEPEGFVCDELGFCQGHLLMADVRNSSTDCLAFCQSEAECQWYSFFGDDGNCLLTTDCPVVDESCSDCVYGQKECSGNVSNGKFRLYVRYQKTNVLTLND
jgi:hypothetical protein